MSAFSATALISSALFMGNLQNGELYPRGKGNGERRDCELPPVLDFQGRNALKPLWILLFN
jgi:hypothetical protein